MPVDLIEDQIEKEDEIKIIKSDNWELPEMNLGSGRYEWRPKTAVLPYYLFEGPSMSKRTHGINLGKDLSIGVHGPRGASKTLTLSFLIAKKLRMNQPSWDNWPVSFYIVEPNCWDACQDHKCNLCFKGALSYYENMPLDMDKVYTFNSELSNGNVGFTEFQYYVEARTSGRQQNRFLSYQIMQIRKSALSFYYDVQNQRWVDNRFGWSDDLKIYCRDVSKMNYDYDQVGRELEEGEYSHWRIRDISGVATGIPYEESGIEYGPYQFDGYNFWWIYPTQWKVSVYDAVYSMKQDNAKADKAAAIGNAVALAVNSFLDEGIYNVLSTEMWNRAELLGDVKIEPRQGGKVLSSLDIPKYQDSKGKWHYNLGVFIDSGDTNKK